MIIKLINNIPTCLMSVSLYDYNHSEFSSDDLNFLTSEYLYKLLVGMEYSLNTNSMIFVMRGSIISIMQFVNILKNLYNLELTDWKENDKDIR